MSGPPRELSPAQVRVLGCLMEKQVTTPDAYPLSLNALRLACNQSTARDPVVRYDEAVIRDALHRLERRGFVRLASGAGSRASKYRHLLAQALPLDGAEHAVMCVLMLRGAQTPGELKQRGERMHAFGDLAAVHDTLERLIDRALVARLERRPGHKEERYAQLLDSEHGEEAAAPVAAPAAATFAAGSAPAAPAAAPDVPPAAPARAVGPPAISTQISGNNSVPAGGDDLRARVARLEREVAELRAALGDTPGGPQP